MYYRYDLYTNVLLVFITLLTNYIFIPIYGINGAAMATALSVFLFNFIRLFLIKVKMKMHPFSIKTIYTVIILFAIYSLVIFLPLSGIVYFDIIWKSVVVFVIFIPAVLYFNLSEDITLLIKDLRNRFLS